MPDQTDSAEIPQDSVGVVVPQRATWNNPLTLKSGIDLPGYELVYETYGELNPSKSNAVLVCHALSGNHHAAGYHRGEERPGWWETAIGPGKAIDTNRFFVVSPNNIGGCHGSTGPGSINPETGKAWGAAFPQVTVEDWVASQATLADRLGIERFAAVIGGSLGGMQALYWAIEHPGRIAHSIAIAAAPWLSAQNIAFNEIARHAIQSDPDFVDGGFLEAGKIPERGLMLARMLGHVTYLSGFGLGQRFGREVRRGDLSGRGSLEFEVESYLHYQGKNFAGKFDANSYVNITRVLDLFDLRAKHGGDLARAFKDATCNFLILAFSSDWRFSPERSKEIVDALVAANKSVVSAVIETEHGHDAFLLKEPEAYHRLLRAYMDRVALGCG